MISYRADIDGLRAIAVLAVVLYHLGLGPLRGGFVGVDIFFVISGFLITGIIQREVGEGRFGYSDFYQRRIRRLFPALFLVLAATLLAGLFLLLPSDLVTLGRTTAATVFYGSNIDLWRHSGYFDGNAELNPLLHTWSLAVEEQFYIGLPILLLLVHRYARRRLGAIVVAVGLVSYALAIFAQSRRPSAVFFLAPFRAWELMAGAVLALGLVPILRQRWLRELLSVAGLGLLAYAILWIEPGPEFPGWIAALPVLGSAALLHAGTSGDTLVGRALSWRPMVYVGLISYSLYLWHWPLIVYAKYLNGLQPLGAWRWAILALAVGLSALSLRFVETPFRKRRLLREPRPLFRNAAIATAATAGIALVLAFGGGWRDRFGPEIVALDRERTPEIPFLACMGRLADPVLGESCVVGAGNEAGPPSVLIWGDSHALAWLPAFDALLREQGLRGLFAGQSACAPLLDVRNPSNPLCAGHNDQVRQLLLDDARLRLVVMVASWPSYSWEGGKYRIEDAEGRKGNPVVFPDALRRTLRFLEAENRVAWLIGPTPGAPSELPLRMAMARRAGDGQPAPIPTVRFEKRRQTFAQALAALPERLPLVFTDPSAWLCDAATCRYETAGLPLYRDRGHLNVRGAAYLRPFLEPAFLEAITRAGLASPLTSAAGLP